MSVANFFKVSPTSAIFPLSVLDALPLATARRFCPLGSTRQGGWQKRGLPRCSPRGTSGQGWGRRIHPRVLTNTLSFPTPPAPLSPFLRPHPLPLSHPPTSVSPLPSPVPP